MRPKARLFLVWLAYAALLVLGSRVLPGNILSAVVIVLGSLLGMLLPKLVSIFSEVYLVPSSAASNSARIQNLFWQDSHSLIPSTKVGQMIYSYPFLFAFGAVALFVVTSTENWFGRAVVLGMGLRLSADLLVSNRDKQILKQRWFTTFSTRLTDSELDIFVYGNLALFLFLTIMAIRS